MARYNYLSLFLLVLGLVLVQEVIGFKHLSKAEENEVDQLLKRLNKPAVTSIHTDFGDIFDCVDFYKQPAFDHPLIKKHYADEEIPMPFYNKPEETTATLSNRKIPETGLEPGCPPGTVPIRRTKKEDILRWPSISRFGKKLATSPAISYSDLKVAGLYISEGKHYGAKANLNLWKPLLVFPDQFSLSEIAVAIRHNLSDANIIEAGWIVHQQLFNDSRPRLFTHWTADRYQSTGCFNTLCSGFVQVSRDIPLGFAWPNISTLHGDQYAVSMRIFWGDNKLWLALDHDFRLTPIGFWSPSVVPLLFNEGADMVAYQGEVLVPRDILQGPGMGSGNFPVEGFGRAAFIDSIQSIEKTENPNAFVTPTTGQYKLIKSVAQCYDIKDDGAGLTGLGVFYGGRPRH